MTDNWERVSKRKPCPVCEKPDWCLAARDGMAAICQRVSEGAVKRCGEAGWLHRFGQSAVRSHKPRPIRIDKVATATDSAGWAELVERFSSRVTPSMLAGLACQLGVSAEGLQRLRVGWDRAAWTFPMVDAASRAIGIRRRLPNGRKLSVKGGREGLFVPIDLPSSGALLICEGPTDTAALLDLAFNAIGRPSCTGGTRYAVHLAKGRHVIIVADADAPGQRGAKRLASALQLYCPSVRIITPPGGITDARAWKQAGATRADIERRIQEAERVRLTVKAS